MNKVFMFSAFFLSGELTILCFKQIWHAYVIKPKRLAFLLLCDCMALQQIHVFSSRHFKDYFMWPGQVRFWGWSKPNRFFQKDQKLAITWSMSQYPDLELHNRFFVLLWLWKSAGDLQSFLPQGTPVVGAVASLLMALRHKLKPVSDWWC